MGAERLAETDQNGFASIQGGLGEPTKIVWYQSTLSTYWLDLQRSHGIDNVQIIENHHSHIFHDEPLALAGSRADEA